MHTDKEIKDTIRFLGNHSYIVDEYTCDNYTRDAVMELRRLGYEAYYVSGSIEGMSVDHAWVKVCQDYDVTVGVVKINESRYHRTSIIDVTEDGEPNGTYCPWMRTEQWCGWYKYNCEEIR